jgi:carboxyl-terminal processing protease
LELCLDWVFPTDIRKFISEYRPSKRVICGNERFLVKFPHHKKFQAWQDLFRTPGEAMKSSFLSAFFIAICFVSQAAAQTNKKSITQLPAMKIEPFKIERGSSFSASVPQRDNQKISLSENAKEIGRAIISQDFRDALEIIRSKHADGARLDQNELTKSSVTSMLRALDPHSNYFDAAEYQDLLNDEQSEYIGIGASIANYNKNGAMETYVTSTFPDSPAFRANLLFGDRIISVNGEKMAGRNSFYVRQKIRGAKGTAVRLVIERNASGKIETLEIKRHTVPQPSIPDAYLLRPGIGYIDLSNGFTYTTNVELEVALKDLREQGMTSLILDLRDNPGGILEQSVKVAEKFLSAGQVIVTQRGRMEIDNRTWKSTAKMPETAALVVLVNGGSASASEIVAGAFQDYDRAIIVGEKTFGKGLVQSVINLPYGAGLTLTTAKYYTPSGRSIQRDYSKGNLYDYFQHKASLEARAKNTVPNKTVTGRNVFGGDGILPDEFVKAAPLSAAQINLLDPLFFFAREAAAGRIGGGLENFKSRHIARYGRRIRPSDFPAAEELLKAFENYAVKIDPLFTAEQINAHKNFILLRLRYNLATSVFGSVAANQVLIENDVQIAKAVNALPRAQNLALAARKNLSRK